MSIKTTHGEKNAKRNLGNTYCAYEDNCTYGAYFRYDDVSCGYNGNGYFEPTCPRVGEQSAGYIDPAAWECITKEACEVVGWTFKDPDECRNGSTQTVNNCGLNFRDPNTRTCTGGRWSGWLCNYKDSCTIGNTVYQIDSDIAEKSDLEPNCGMNLRGIHYAFCPDGQWAEHHCADPDVCVDDTSRHIGSCGYNVSACIVNTHVRICTMMLSPLAIWAKCIMNPSQVHSTIGF